MIPLSIAEADFIEIESPFAIRIELEDGKIERVYDQLALALDQTESERSVDRIRECPICSEIFWAGSADKETCSKHAARWRKSQQRQRNKEAKERREKNRVKRNERQAGKPLKPSDTTWAIINAVIEERLRTWKSIDYHCYYSLAQIKSG